MKNEKVDIEALEALALQLQEERSNFLQTLVDLRKRSGLTQHDVAERMGVTQPTVSEFERYDANPRLETILRYALAIDANLDLRAYEAQAFRTEWNNVSEAQRLSNRTTAQLRPRAWEETIAG